LPMLARFVRAAHDVLFDAGYALLLSNSEGNPERERQLIAVMAARKADALIIAHHSETDNAVNELLKRTKLPVVLVDRKTPAWADSVLVDHRNGIRQATNSLLKMGHRRISLLTGMVSLYPARERVAGFKLAHKDNRLTCDEKLIRTGSFERDFGFEQTSLLLSAKRRPTAIIAGGIGMLPGVLQAIRMRNLTIPKDISLVSALDSDLSELFTPTISVERWNYAEVGRLAARFALNRIAGEGNRAPRRVIIPTEFLQRDSIAPPHAR
jgi:LacI family transcriptional regulator, galactose operon repressor